MTTSANSPTAIVQSGGGTAWTIPSQAALSTNDATFCNCSLAGGGAAFSEQLNSTAFGFAVPATAQIQGIQLDLYGAGATDGFSGIYESSLILRNAGANIGTDKGRGFTSLWPNTNGLIASFGGSADLWGASLTPAIVNSATFGFGLVIRNSNASNTRSGSVGYAVLTVTYLISASVTAADSQPADTVTVTSAVRLLAAAVVQQPADSLTGTLQGVLHLSVASALPLDGFGIAIDKGHVSASLSDALPVDTYLVSAQRGYGVAPDRNVTIVEIGPASLSLHESASASVILGEKAGTAVEV